MKWSGVELELVYPHPNHPEAIIKIGGIEAIESAYSGVWVLGEFGDPSYREFGSLAEMLAWMARQAISQEQEEGAQP